MSTSDSAVYPKQYESRIILKDGSVIQFRPIKVEDADKWLEFYESLSERTKYLRMQYVPKEMDKEGALRYCTVDYTNTFAFIAEAKEDRETRIVAVGRYSRMPSGSTAEIAFVIEDEYQERGIGTKLIEWLAIVARNNDIDTFEALVLTENTGMLSVFQGYGFHMKREIKGNAYQITFPLTKTPEVIKKKEERALAATINSLKHIMNPRSVAVIGASNRPGAIGQLVFQSMIQSGFTGVVYPVSSRSSSVMAVKSYYSVLDIPDEIDLAIIVVPASQVLNVTDECGRKKVKGIIVISDGFKERGEEGAALENELRETAFGYGMRIIGPNCMGLINTDPKVNLNATFALIQPDPGNIAFITQSGALGLGILQYAKSLDIGFSSYISVGNRTDIASTDMLQYWEKDPATKVILLYLESFDNPDIFSRISRRISAKKPILAIKGGNTAEGSKAASSHTGAMATPAVVSDALFHQAGILRIRNIEDIFHSAMLLANQPVPKGRNVAILTNGGGPGTLAADACAQHGLILPDISDETLKKLRAVMKRDIGISNPFDLTAGISAVEFENALKILVEDPDFDSIVTIYIPPAGENIDDIEEAIKNSIPVLTQYEKPIVACFVGQTGIKGRDMTDDHFVPYYMFPEDAVLALAHAVRYGEIQRKENGSIPEFQDVDRKKAKQLIKDVLTGNSERPLWVPPVVIDEVFKCYGIKAADMKIALSEDDAVSAADQMGYPVVVKLESSTISHKSDVGGIVLNVKTPDEVKKAFSTIRDNLKKIGRENEMQGVMVQKMVTEGSEVIIGLNENSTLGHVIMFGLGGIYAELINDSALRLHPLTDTDVRELIDSVKMSKLLKGYRGSEPLDTGSLEDLLLRVSAMVEDIPQIAEMDLNPVKVLPQGSGYCVVDSRMMIK
ncbi:MAG: GNAT family N-acetyltransferase [Spirochaetes bacterium]|nr:GNAT family N-acetyltransferase [Spirochaetota bacterium]